MRDHSYEIVREFTPLERADGGEISRLLAADEHGAHRSITLMHSSAGAERQLSAAAEAVALVEDYDVFPQFIGHGIEQSRREDIAWVERWVRGVRLTDLIDGKWRSLTVTDFQQLLVDLSEALAALRSVGVEHGAISPETIIWAEPPAGSIEPKFRFRLVNMSSCRRLGEGESGRTDELAVLRVAGLALNELLRRPDIPAEARSYLIHVRDFIVEAANDVIGGAELPLSRLLALSRSSGHATPPVRSPEHLVDPFDFLSTEHFSSDSLLYDVFAQSCPWIDEVARPVPTLIEGPRGCGKSMVLRWLSVKTQLAGPEPVSSLEALEIAGFYVACASEIQSRIARFNTPELARGHRVELIHYLNMVILREVAATLLRLSEVSEPSWGMSEPAAVDIWSFIVTEVDAARPLAAGINIWEQIRDLAFDQLSLSHDALEGVRKPSRFTVGSFAHDLARTLTERVAFFAHRRVAYCLDDYSTHRIPASVQEIFNEVVFSVRSGNHVFKISAENRGFHPFTTSGARIDLQREMTRIDFGSSYLESAERDPSSTRRFSRDLLANRLASAGWVGTPEQLIGPSEQSNLEFARRVRAKDRSEPPLYSGLESIADLCSGDVANLLLVYKHIFVAAKAKPEQTTRIDASVQDKAIRRASRYLIELIQSNVPHGGRMLKLVEEFAQLAQFAMVGAPMIKNHGATEPRMQTRIEVDGLTIHHQDARQDQNDPFLAELLRKAIFVELKPGVARHGLQEGTSQNSARLMLRRIYLPAHGLSLSKNLAWVWSASQFTSFLEDPHRFCVAQRHRFEKSYTDADALFGLGE